VREKYSRRNSELEQQLEEAKQTLEMQQKKVCTTINKFVIGLTLVERERDVKN
jgi:hypothetical protein